jgi:hypothetical protein
MFYSWEQTGCNDFATLCAEIEEAGKTEPIYNKIFWIGNSTTHPSRHILPELAQKKEVFEFIAMNWIREKSVGNRHAATQYVSLPDHCKYKYLLDIRGNGWSGRVKFLLFSQRPLFYVERNVIGWQEEGLEAFKHYIPVKSDCSDLEEKYQWAEANPDKCKEIAQNALDFAKQKYSEENILKEFKDIVLDFTGTKQAKNGMAVERERERERESNNDEIYS